MPMVPVPVQLPTGESASFEYDPTAKDPNLGRPLSPDEAKMVFLHNFSLQNPQANPAAVPGAAATPPGTPSTGMMNPNQPGMGEQVLGVLKGLLPKVPTSWDELKDTAKSLASGVPDAGINLADTATTRIPLGLQALGQHAFTGEISPELKAKANRREATWDKLRSFTGADYEPQTIPGSEAKSGAEAATGIALTGGLSAPEIALGYASGLLGNKAARITQDPSTGQSSDLVQAAASALPYLARGAYHMTPLAPAAALREARSALDQMHPGEMQAMKDAEGEAQRAGIPSMVWQNAPPQSTVRNMGLETALQPTSEATQERLRDLWGGTQGAHDAADNLAVRQMFPGAPGQPGMVQNPAAAQALESALRTTDALRGSHFGIRNVTGAPTEEAGHIALGSELLGEVIPHKGIPLIGSLALTKAGALKRMFKGPEMRQADELASQTSLEDYARMANTNTKLPIYKNMLQGAFSVPGATGLYPKLGEDSQ